MARRRRTNLGTPTCQFVAVMAKVAIAMHGVGAFLVICLWLLAVTASVSTVSEKPVESLAAFPVSGAFVAIALVAIAYLAMPWAVVLLFCEIANDVAQTAADTAKALARDVEYQQAALVAFAGLSGSIAKQTTSAPKQAKPIVDPRDAPDFISDSPKPGPPPPPGRG